CCRQRSEPMQFPPTSGRVPVVKTKTIRVISFQGRSSWRLAAGGRISFGGVCKNSQPFGNFLQLPTWVSQEDEKKGIWGENEPVNDPFCPVPVARVVAKARPRRRQSFHAKKISAESLQCRRVRRPGSFLTWGHGSCNLGQSPR